VKWKGGELGTAGFYFADGTPSQETSIEREEEGDETQREGMRTLGWGVSGLARVSGIPDVVPQPHQKCIILFFLNS
jgi:hypothetical protein